MQAHVFRLFVLHAAVQTPRLARAFCAKSLTCTSGAAQLELVAAQDDAQRANGLLAATRKYYIEYHYNRPRADLDKAKARAESAEACAADLRGQNAELARALAAARPEAGGGRATRGRGRGPQQRRQRAGVHPCHCRCILVGKRALVQQQS